MADGFNDIAGASFSLRANKRCTFGDPTECLAKVLCTTDERYLECVLVNVVLLVCRSQNFGFIDVVDTDGLDNLNSDSFNFDLRFGMMSYNTCASTK